MFYLHVDVSAPASLTPCHANKTFIELTEGFEKHLFAKKLHPLYCQICVMTALYK